MMSTFIDRLCEHGLIWCYEGCHDNIGYEPHGLIELLCGRLEDWANDGQLPDFFRSPDPATGYDGLDELIEDALVFWPAHGNDDFGGVTT
jgi:hypothetical protein